MSNPFKVGDKVVRLNHSHGVLGVGQIGEVVGYRANGGLVIVAGDQQGWAHDPKNLRAAVAGLDYPAAAPPQSKFKVGDKVTCAGGWTPRGTPMNVTRVEGTRVWTDNCLLPNTPNEESSLYLYAEAPPTTPKSHTGGANMGHLPDGSSVQKHSAGPLYPCVIAMRDGILGDKYDYGVISPRNQEPLWLSTHEAAVTLAEIIKKDLT